MPHQPPPAHEDLSASLGDVEGIIKKSMAMGKDNAFGAGPTEGPEHGSDTTSLTVDNPQGGGTDQGSATKGM